MKNQAELGAAGKYQIETTKGFAVLSDLSLAPKWISRIVFVDAAGGTIPIGAPVETLIALDPRKEKAMAMLRPELDRRRKHLARTGRRLKGEGKPRAEPEISEEERQEKEFAAYIAGIGATYETRRKSGDDEIARVIVTFPIKVGLYALSMLFRDWDGCRSTVGLYLEEPDADQFEWPDEEDESLDTFVRTSC